MTKKNKKPAHRAAEGPVIVSLGYGADKELEDAGAISLPIHINEKDIDEMMAFGVDGVVFLGGGDIDPEKYRRARHPEVYGIDHTRDRLEARVMRWAIENDVPMMGICRGMQMINVLHGGTLIQDLPSMRVHDHWGRPHRVQVDPISQLYQAVESEDIRGMSYHHQAVEMLGDGLLPVAWDHQGVIEAIESDPNRETFILGTQFHPEMDASWTESSQEIFNYFVWRVAQLRGLTSFQRRHYEPMHRAHYYTGGTGYIGGGSSEGSGAYGSYKKWWEDESDDAFIRGEIRRRKINEVVEGQSRWESFTCDHYRMLDEDCAECDELFYCSHGQPTTYDCADCMSGQTTIVVARNKIIPAKQTTIEEALMRANHQLVSGITDRLTTPAERRRKSGAQRRKAKRTHLP